MQTTTISVVIPVYNASHMLTACMESVWAQERRPDQVIVVDDGSTDHLAHVLATLPADVVVLRQPHRGPGAARNAGLAVATGTCVSFLDADDLWRPGFLRACESFMLREPAAVAVSTGGVIRDARGRERPLPAGGRGAIPAAPTLLPDFFAFWAHHDHVRTGTVLMRGDVVRGLGGQRDDLWISQDLEFWACLATFGPWGFIPEPLWIGNSQAAAHATGWREKYAERRRRCPTVDAWESRIVSRLHPGHEADFRKVRGRVAAGFIHAKALGGDAAGARALFRRYRADLPHNRVTGLLRAAEPFGLAGWRSAVALLRAREGMK
ncbi:MAG: glycosyltransferase family 2 protein [Lentisphaerae bacterium]|nr:glycosyltransferase family 2 protein [Lentisphaerota bacterium]